MSKWFWLIFFSILTQGNRAKANNNISWDLRKFEKPSQILWEFLYFLHKVSRQLAPQEENPVWQRPVSIRKIWLHSKRNILWPPNNNLETLMSLLRFPTIRRNKILSVHSFWTENRKSLTFKIQRIDQTQETSFQESTTVELLFRQTFKLCNQPRGNNFLFWKIYCVFSSELWSLSLGRLK